MFASKETSTPHVSRLLNGFNRFLSLHGASPIKPAIKRCDIISQDPSDEAMGTAAANEPTQSPVSNSKRLVLRILEGRGLRGHHTTPGLIVSGAACPRHPAE